MLLRLERKRKPVKPSPKVSNPESGSVFTVLLAAIAIAGALSVVLYQTVSGPMSSMVRVTNKTSTKSQMQAIANILIMDAVNNMPANGDCAGKGFVVPRSWKPGTGPAGSYPAGGGLLPTTIGAPTTDPWGTPYGYCMWEMGYTSGPLPTGAGTCDVSNGYNQTCTTTGGCSGGTGIYANSGYNSLRRYGSPAPTTGNSGSQTVIAIISAGPDRKFESSCADYVNGTTNVVTAGGDDVVLQYTYAEASAATSSLWTLSPSNPAQAIISKNLDIGTAPSTIPSSLSGYSNGIINANGIVSQGAIIAGGAVQLADNVATQITQNPVLDSSCVAGDIGAMRYNTTSNTIEVCSCTGTGTIWTGSPLSCTGTPAWTAISGTGANTPNAFAFTNVSAQTPGATVTSNAVTLSGFTGVMEAFCGAGCIDIIHNGIDCAATLCGGFASGDTIAIRQVASSSYGTPTSTTVQVGNTQSAAWVVTTENTANAFSFTDVTGQPVSSTIQSNAVALSWTGGGVLTATCGAGCIGISRNGGSFVAGPVSGFVTGDTIAIEQTSSSSYGTVTTATVTVGNTVSSVWHVTTQVTADPFSFTNVTGQPLGTTIQSNAVALNWTGGGTLTATCGSGCTGISRNGGSFVAGPVSGFVTGDTIAIKQTSSGSYDTVTTATVTVGVTASSTWSVTTVNTASAFSFTNVTGQPLGTTIQSNAVALNWTGGGTLTATCGSGCTGISRNGGAFVAGPVSGFVTGDTIAIKQTSSGSYGTQTSATVTVGNTTSATWNVTTQNTAAAFSFTDVTGQPFSTTIQSNAVALSWSGGGTLTATCGAGCIGISRNGGGFVAGPVSGFVTGDTIAIEQTSSGSYGTVTTATVTVGGTTSSIWHVTTINTATAFSFTNVNGQQPSTTIMSNAVALSWAGGGTLTATCGTGCTGISRNGGAFVAGPVSNFASGDTIAIQQTSSSSLNTMTTATVTVGSTTSSSWTVTTWQSCTKTIISQASFVPTLSQTISYSMYGGGGGGNMYAGAGSNGGYQAGSVAVTTSDTITVYVGGGGGGGGDGYYCGEGGAGYYGGGYSGSWGNGNYGGGGGGGSTALLKNGILVIAANGGAGGSTSGHPGGSGGTGTSGGASVSPSACSSASGKYVGGGNSGMFGNANTGGSNSISDGGGGGYGGGGGGSAGNSNGWGGNGGSSGGNGAASTGPGGTGGSTGVGGVSGNLSSSGSGGAGGGAGGSAVINYVAAACTW